MPVWFVLHCFLCYYTQNLPQLILQIVFSIVISKATIITVFSGILSIISIVSSVFEHVSLRYLLATETIIVFKVDVESMDASEMKPFYFKQLSNYKRAITREVGKYFQVNYRVVELLAPIQTNIGINMIFHIRLQGDERNDIEKIINMMHKDQNEICQLIFNKWKSQFPMLKNTPKIINMETREIKPQHKNINEKQDINADLAVVVKLGSVSTTQTPKMNSSSGVSTPGANSPRFDSPVYNYITSIATQLDGKDQIQVQDVETPLSGVEGGVDVDIVMQNQMLAQLQMAQQFVDKDNPNPVVSNEAAL